MKKTCFALSFLGLAIGSSGGVAAQTQVTLFGVVDLGVAHVSHGHARLTALSYSGNSHARLGFRGTEDLGGGGGGRGGVGNARGPRPPRARQ